MAAEIAKKSGGDRHLFVSGSVLAEGETFSAVLRRFMEGHGLSITSLARHSWLDIAYVWRLVRDENDLLNPQPGGARARHPSRDAVIRLGLALRLGIEEMDELLLAAGYAPLVR